MTQHNGNFTPENLSRLNLRARKHGLVYAGEEMEVSMNFIEKLKQIFNRLSDSAYDGKYSRHNQPELKNEKRLNAIRDFPSSVKGVRPFANADEKNDSRSEL